MNLFHDTRDTSRDNGGTPFPPAGPAGEAFSSLEAEVSRARSKNEALALVLVCADQLDEIERSLGSWMREAAVAAVSFRVRQVTRTGDRICRLPGGGVAVVVRACPARHVPSIAHRILHAILSAPLVGPDGAIPLSASAGIALLGPDGDRARPLFERGLKALCEAQESGTYQLRMATDPAPILPC